MVHAPQNNLLFKLFNCKRKIYFWYFLLINLIRLFTRSGGMRLSYGRVCKIWRPMVTPSTSFHSTAWKLVNNKKFGQQYYHFTFFRHYLN